MTRGGQAPSLGRQGMSHVWVKRGLDEKGSSPGEAVRVGRLQPLNGGEREPLFTWSHGQKCPWNSNKKLKLQSMCTRRPFMYI